MPQACVIRMPTSRSNALWRAGGTADPPQMMQRSRPSRPRACFMGSSMACQIVGTPAAKVTPRSTRSDVRTSGVMKRPGMTTSVPAMNAAYGNPHALAWNMGTMAITTSLSRTPKASAMHRAIECRTFERWL